MWWLCATALAAGPVSLSPQLPEGRAIHWTVEQTFDGGESHQGRTVWEVHERLGTGEVRLGATSRARNPLPVLWLLWPEVVSTSQAVLTPGEPGALMPGGPPLSVEDVAFGSCAALPGLWVVLPSTPVTVGETWSLGAVTCTFTDADARLAHVTCEGKREREAPWVSEAVERRLEVDLDAGLITRCEATLTHEVLPATNSWRAEEIAEGRLGDPDDGAGGCNRIAAVGLLSGLLLLGGLWWRRRVAA